MRSDTLNSGMAALPAVPAKRDSAPWLQFGVSFAVTLLVVAPVLIIAYQSLQTAALYESDRTWTLSNYTKLLAQGEFFQAVRNSLALACVATAVALAVGLPSAIAFSRVDLPFRSWLETAMLAPIYVSQLVLAFGWYVLYGPSGYLTMVLKRAVGDVPWDLASITGMGVLGGMAMAPYVMLNCMSSLALTDASLEDAARVSGASPWRVIRTITVPLLKPAIVYLVLLTFVGGLEMLSIPLIFGWPAGLEFFTTYLLREGLGRTVPDYGMLGAAAFLLLALVAVCVLLQRRLVGAVQRYVTVRGKAQRPKPLHLGVWRWVVAGALGLYVLFTAVLPLASLVLRSVVRFLTPLVSPFDYLTLDHFKALLHQEVYVRAMINTVTVSAVGAALTAALVALAAIIVHRSDNAYRRSLEMFLLLPRAVPGMVVGIGFLWVTLWTPGLSLLHGTIWILIIAYTMRGLPTAYAAIGPSLMQIGREIDQSARVSGAGWWTTCWKIVLPIAKTALGAAYLLLFLAFFKEYAAAVYLTGAGGEVIGTELLHMWAKGDAGPVAALSVVQLAFTLILAGMIRRMSREQKPWLT